MRRAFRLSRDGDKDGCEETLHESIEEHRILEEALRIRRRNERWLGSGFELIDSHVGIDHQPRRDMTKFLQHNLYRIISVVITNRHCTVKAMVGPDNPVPDVFEGYTVIESCNHNLELLRNFIRRNSTRESLEISQNQDLYRVTRSHLVRYFLVCLFDHDPARLASPYANFPPRQ